MSPLTLEQRRLLRARIDETVRQTIPTRETGSCIVCCEDFTPRRPAQACCFERCSKRLASYRRYRRLRDRRAVA